MSTDKKGLCAEEVCDEFLKSNQETFALESIDLQRRERVEGTATQSIRYDQRHLELPVFGARLVVGMRKRDKHVTQAVNSIDYDIPAEFGPGAARLNAAAARAAVASAVGPPRFESYQEAAPELMIYRHRTAEWRELARPAPMRDEMLALGRGTEGEIYLVWQCRVDTHGPFGQWDLFIDAIDGGIVAVHDRRRYDSRRGNVFWPDPITSSHNDNLNWTSPAGTLDAERREVTLENLASPSAGTYKLDGKYVVIRQIESPNVAPPETTGDFRFGAKDREFLACMVYYYLDRFIDHVRGFGVKKFNDDTQTPLRADPQGLGGADNSHFVVPISGAPYIAFGEGGVPDAADPAVIIHEFGHALHHFINGDGSAVYEEGASDFIAACWLDRFNELQFQREKVMPWDNNKSINWGPKRRLDLSERFDDPGFAAYGMYLKGDILATALWRLYLSIGGDSADDAVRAAAADRAVHVYMEMLVSSNPTGSALDEAKDLVQGLIQADHTLNGGANKQAIVDAFRLQGLTIGGPGPVASLGPLPPGESSPGSVPVADLESYPPPHKHSVTASKQDQVSALIGQVSPANLESWVSHLSGYHTRHSLSPTIHRVADWLDAQFGHFGYTAVQRFAYTRHGHQLENVVCTKPGTSSSGRIVLVCAHHDSIMQQPQNATARAPGADDNASGVAAMLEVARVLAYQNLETTVQFVAFSGEEQGLWGATAYAQHLKATGANLYRLINLDQVGFPPPDRTIKIERDMGNKVSGNDQASHELADLMAALSREHTDLKVSLDRIWSSDYMPFEARGYVVAGLYEAGDYPAYHSDQDTPDKLEYGYLTGVTKITLATVLHVGGAMLEPRPKHLPERVGGVARAARTKQTRTAARNRRKTATTKAKPSSEE